MIDKFCMRCKWQTWSHGKHNTDSVYIPEDAVCTHNEVAEIHPATNDVVTGLLIEQTITPVNCYDVRNTNASCGYTGRFYEVKTHADI